MTTQAERRNETIGAIDGAAQQLFSTRGFFDTTVDDIVAQAGVAKGAFYHHYESKEAVFTNVLERLQSALAREVMEGAAKSATPVAALRSGLRIYIEACERSDVRQILLLDGPSVLGWMRWREIDDKYFGEMTRRAVAAATGKKAAGLHVQAIAALIAGAFAEAAMLSAAGSKYEPKDIVEAMNVLLSGIERSGTKPVSKRQRVTRS
jgi:AcrR family transcriptional regulator